MSTTFTIQAKHTGVYRAECDLVGELAQGEAAQVVTAISAHPWRSCRGCGGYQPAAWPVTDVPSGLEVNLANSNAQRVLMALDLPAAAGDLAGELPAEDFLARIILALAGDFDDAAIPAVESGRLTHGGRREGYLEHTLLRLHALALNAVRLHRPVTWS